MARAPLSARHDPERFKEYNALHDGVPDWMLESAQQWTKQFLYFNGRPSASKVAEAEQYLRVRLNRNGIVSEEYHAIEDLLSRMTDGALGLDLIDYCLGLSGESASQPANLQVILDRSGSAWTVGRDEEGNFCLERRVDATVEAAARAEMAETGNGAAYLRSAWHLAYGRDPNASAAYRDAIRAVEAAARPTVTPNDAVATLGKMIPALRDAPQKWETEIGDVETVRKMMEAVWQAQHDRHGTDDETKPVNVSQPEAEAAVQYAVTLVHLFRTGVIRPVR